jgi:hypothetical protein
MLWDEKAGNHADVMEAARSYHCHSSSPDDGHRAIYQQHTVHTHGRPCPPDLDTYVCTCPVCVAVAGIAAADAISVALCLLAFLYMTKLAGRYVADVKPRNSARASDFTILVRGLPDVTPADVSHPTSTRHLTLRVAVASWFAPNLDA